jgi:hypothetical protein
MEFCKRLYGSRTGSQKSLGYGHFLLKTAPFGPENGQNPGFAVTDSSLCNNYNQLISC